MDPASRNPRRPMSTPRRRELDLSDEGLDHLIRDALYVDRPSLPAEESLRQTIARIHRHEQRWSMRLYRRLRALIGKPLPPTYALSKEPQ